MNSISLVEGLHVRYRDYTGFIRFISEHYLTLCIRQFEHKKNDVCILVYRNNWGEIALIKESEK
jgi:hypothetical protein